MTKVKNYVDEFDFKPATPENPKGSFTLWGTKQGIAFNREFDSNDLYDLFFFLWKDGKAECTDQEISDFFTCKFYNHFTVCRYLGNWLDENEPPASPRDITPRFRNEDLVGALVMDFDEALMHMQSWVR